MSVRIRPHRFALDAAIVDWATLARPRPDLAAVLERLKRAERPNAALQLRWSPHRGLGLPSGPFKVWALEDQSKFAPESIAFTTYVTPEGYRAVTWSKAMVWVALRMNAGSAASAAFGFFGAPLIANVNCWTAVAAGGPQTIILSGASAITGVLLANTVTASAFSGVPAAIGEGDGWRLIETVGLPVETPEWSGSGWDVPQGMTGALVSPGAAALQRLARGAPPAGWWPELRPGTPAPPWAPPRFPELIRELNEDLLARVATLLPIAPNAQHVHQATETIAPPGAMGGASTATYPPLGALLLSAMTDPFPNLALGFGTAYDFASANSVAPGVAAPQAGLQDAAHVAMAARVRTPNPVVLRVTGEWRNGLDGRSPAVAYGAVVVPAPFVIPPPPPAALEALQTGFQTPLAPDGPWRVDFRLRWERLVRQGLIRPASFAVARRRTTPSVTAPESLMGERRSGGPIPAAIAKPRPTDIEPTRAHFPDQDFEIPNDPGSVAAIYGVAQQNLYGVWSPWSATDASAMQPPLEPVRITAVGLTPVAPTGGALCPATLSIEFVLDWRVRTPQSVRFVAALYPADTRAQDPPSFTPPASFPRSLGGADGPIVVTFSGDTPSSPAFVGPGATPDPTNPYIQAVALDPATNEDVFVVAGPATQPGPMRRYRMTVPGFALDFSTRPHIGLAVWGRRAAPRPIRARRSSRLSPIRS
jgi:hypothetical protein